MKKYLLLMLPLLLCPSLYSQDATSADINAIKMQTDTYLYGESTDENWEIAKENAEFDLMAKLEDWLKQSDSDTVAGVIARAKKKQQVLRTMRGTRFRAFVYIRYADLVLYDKTDKPIIVAADSNVQGRKTAAEPLNVESRKTAAEPLNVESRKTAAEPLNVESRKTALTALEKAVLPLTDAPKVLSFIRQAKQDGRIAEYGTYKTMPADFNGNIVVYNRDMKVTAVLRKTGKQYLNLSTLQEDDISNYKGCGGVWFR